MYSLVNANFSRTYNPNIRQNPLCEIKRLLSSRDTSAQSRACGYLKDIVNRHKLDSGERSRMIELLLDSDITVFLCEATSNLDFSLYRSVLACIRLLWRERRFFAEEHAAQCMAAAARALTHYSTTGGGAAVDVCLHFICDLLSGISLHGTTSPLSIQSFYSVEQLLACINALVPRINTNLNTVLRGALVIQALVSYQPENIVIRGNTAKTLIEVLGSWFELLLATLNRLVLVGDCDQSGMLLVVICQIGMDCLRIIKLLSNGKQPTNFVQSILTDNPEITLLSQCAAEMSMIIKRVMSDLITFVKDNEHEINSKDYTVFLKLLLIFLNDCAQTEASMDFCDMLFFKGYLTMLPQNPAVRVDITVRKVSTLVLGEMLKVLAEKYLFSNTDKDNFVLCANNIHLGLVELQRGLEKPENIGLELQKSRQYSLLIYIYFYCQSCENPEDATAPLLPYLVDHVSQLPKSFTPPAHIVKALWLVFAMSTISNGSLESLDERVFVERAADRLVAMLRPDPSLYYTHNPAILFWAFTSLRIASHMRVQVLSEWLKIEDSLPEDLIKVPLVWELLLDVLIQSQDNTILVNCREALSMCMEKGDESVKQEFASVVWSTLSKVLSKTLIDCENEVGSNTCYLLDLARKLVPKVVSASDCLQIALFVTTIFAKNVEGPADLEAKYHYEFVCMKLCLLLLKLTNKLNDQRVLVTYIDRPGFLPAAVTASNSADDGVACAALKLLSYVVHYFFINKYQPKAVLEIQTDQLIKSFRRDTTKDRVSSLLQFVHMILNAGTVSPMTLTRNIEVSPPETRQCDALRALMFRIQLLLCGDSKNQLSGGWKALNSIFKYAIICKNDPKLVASLISQPWTYTLIRFQLTHDLTQEFLSFSQSWLTLFKINMKKSQEEAKFRLSKYSLITRTLVSMEKSLVTSEDGLKDLRENVLQTVKDLIDEFCVRTSSSN